MDMLRLFIIGDDNMKYSLNELKNVLIYAQESDNQPLINSCAEDIARLICDIEPNLNYDDILYQYGYRSNYKKK